MTTVTFTSRELFPAERSRHDGSNRSAPNWWTAAPPLVRRHRLEVLLAVLPFFLLAAAVSVVGGSGAVAYLALGLVFAAMVAVGAVWVRTARSAVRVRG